MILTTQDEIDLWLNASPEEALRLQRPLAAGALKIVARGSKQDGNDFVAPVTVEQPALLL